MGRSCPEIRQPSRPPPSDSLPPRRRPLAAACHWPLPGYRMPVWDTAKALNHLQDRPGARACWAETGVAGGLRELWPPPLVSTPNRNPPLPQSIARSLTTASGPIRKATKRPSGGPAVGKRVPTASDAACLRGSVASVRLPAPLSSAACPPIQPHSIALYALLDVCASFREDSSVLRV